MVKSFRVAILLVLYNEELYIERLAKSIINQTYKNISVYAVDNNSSDSSASLLLNYIPDTNLVLSKDNLGFAKGNNLIAQKAIDNNEDFLFILNTDMELDPECVSSLVDFIIDEDEVIGIGPIIYFGNHRGRTENIQCYADNTNFTNARTKSLYTDSNISFLEIPQKIYVNTLHGGCFLIRSSAVLKVGLFCEDNFMYNDEIDLAYRINKLGGKLLVTKKAKAWHFHDWTRNNKLGYYIQYFYINRNRFLFFYRYNKYFSIIREILIESFLFPLKIFWAKKTAGIKLLKYYYLGYMHGLLNNKGKADIEFK
jgi:GT2 family glycosyltransferase